MIACAVVCLSGLFAANAAQAEDITIDTVSAYGAVSYEVYYEAGHVAEIVLIGDGTTDLDLYVYGADGSMITSESLSDVEGVSFLALTTGYYTIEVHNFGSVWNEFVLTTF